MSACKSLLTREQVTFSPAALRSGIKGSTKVTLSQLCIHQGHVSTWFLISAPSTSLRSDAGETKLVFSTQPQPQSLKSWKGLEGSLKINFPLPAMDRNIFQIAPSPIQPEMPPHHLLLWEQTCPGQGEARDGKISSWDCSTGRTHPIHLTSPDTGGTNKNPHHRPPSLPLLPVSSPGGALALGSQHHQAWENPPRSLRAICPNTPLSLKHRASPSLLLLPPISSGSSLEPAPAPQSSLLVPGEGARGVQLLPVGVQGCLAHPPAAAGR